MKLKEIQAGGLTWTATVLPPIHLSDSSMRAPNRNARFALAISPCKSPIATSRSAGGRKVERGVSACRKRKGKMLEQLVNAQEKFQQLSEKALPYIYKTGMLIQHRHQLAS